MSAVRTGTQPIQPFTVLRTAPSVHGTRVVEMLLTGSEVDDGGKWAILCEHYAEDGDVIGTGIVQDTNRRRLWSWARHSVDWCCYCQEIRDTPSN